jgi:hypothetical protein
MEFVIGLIIGLLVLVAIDKLDVKYKLKFFCHDLRWHKAPLKQGHDGASYTGACPRCGKKVLQDSNGDWF